MPAKGKCPGDADGTQGIEPVGILYHAAFERVHRRLHAGSFERQIGDDLANVIDRRRRDIQAGEPRPGGPRTGGFVAAVEFPIGDVVQQRRELHDEGIGPFEIGQPQRGAPHAIDMPPIVPCAFAGEDGPRVVGGLVDDALLIGGEFHRWILLGW